MNVNGISYIVSGIAVPSCFACPWGGPSLQYTTGVFCKIENQRTVSHPHKNPPSWCPLRDGPIEVRIVRNPEADEVDAKAKAWEEENKKRMEEAAK